MRLASLARKIKITPSKLSEYLIGQNVDLSQGSNTKLTDAQIAQILLFFGKELPKEEEPEIPVAKVTVEIEKEKVASPTHTEPIKTVKAKVVKAVKEKAVKPPVKKKVTKKKTEAEAPAPVEKMELPVVPPLVEEPPVTIVDHTYLNKRGENDDEIGLTERAALDANVKIIKPPKIVLQGLTVKGKIELPQPKIKEVPEKVEEEEAPVDPNKIVYTSGPKRDERRNPRHQKHKPKDPNYNPIEAERKRKAEKERREHEQKLKALKKAKAHHYEQKVVHKMPVAKVAKEQIVDAPKKPAYKKEKPAPTKNPLKKFWRWMNT